MKVSSFSVRYLSNASQVHYCYCNLSGDCVKLIFVAVNSREIGKALVL